RGEARAVNINNVVADDVYRVHEQIHSSMHRSAKLKHRKVGEFREVPLPRSVREAIEGCEEKHGTTKEGYLLLGPSGYYTEPMERRRVRGLFEKLPVVDGMGTYGFRHYFASNALDSGSPITDVAQWMGHKSIEKTYRTYRHLMPGSITKAARVLAAGLWDAAEAAVKPVRGWPTHPARTRPLPEADLTSTESPMTESGTPSTMPVTGRRCTRRRAGCRGPSLLTPAGGTRPTAS
ncbi:tyrosine-type recombinase/integrase, partial [Streptomyces sp. NPDC057074]|uniref:tyrosine-type recombinase/integrase n=1 Tax=Streptomyces sp. NPDC057074 TaxID=3346015 RepID=UPI00363CAE3C